MSLSLLFCFDKNYNLQAFSSIISFLDNSLSPLNIYIIHKSESTLDFIPEIIKNHKNLEKIKIFKFNLNSSFPDIEGTHVSEATYYRLFFEYFINDPIEYITYVDSDIICNKEPNNFIERTIDNLKNSSFAIACKTESLKNQYNEEIFNRINMQSSKYFNAGVMVIDINKWKNQNISRLLIETLKKIDFKLHFWDQDLFNHYFDGSYVEFNDIFNWNIILENTYSKLEESKIFENVILFHFYGKTKPWVSRGLFSKYSFIYHENFRKINNDHYHIVHNYFLNSVVQLLIAIINFKFFKNIDKKSNFIYLFIKNYVNKRLQNNE